jgi:hypothetical protein
MNYHSHVKWIHKLLLRPEKRKNTKGKFVDQFYKGVYVISRDVKDVNYKMGMAHGMGGIYERMKSYYNCFPYESEFFIHFCVLSLESKDTKKLEKALLNKTIKNAVPNPRNTKLNTEYRTLKKKADLHNSILRVLKDHPKLWSYVVVFGENGWRLLKNDGADRVDSGILSIPAKSYTLKPLPFGKIKCIEQLEIKDYEKTQSEDVIDLQTGNAVDILTIKRGDFIKDRWSKRALVVSISKAKSEITVTSDRWPEGYRLIFS